jgi:hypothetical protein
LVALACMLILTTPRESKHQRSINSYCYAQECNLYSLISPDYHNFVFVSTTTINTGTDKELISIGAFNKVFVLKDLRELSAVLL